MKLEKHWTVAGRYENMNLRRWQESICGVLEPRSLQVQRKMERKGRAGDSQSKSGFDASSFLFSSVLLKEEELKVRVRNTEYGIRSTEYLLLLINPAGTRP